MFYKGKRKTTADVSLYTNAAIAEGDMQWQMAQSLITLFYRPLRISANDDLGCNLPRQSTDSGSFVYGQSSRGTISKPSF